MANSAILNIPYGVRPNEEEANTAGASNLPIDQRQREAAQYISDMILEMRNLARSVRLYNVMVPLEYAYYEAFSAANRVEVPAAEVERIRELAKAAEEAEGTPSNS